MQTDREYEQQERALHAARLREIEAAPLAERREAAREYECAMRERTATIAGRISWLLEGCYGKGAQLAARDVLARPRMNRAAWLSQTIAALEWSCPAREAREAWKRLTAAEQATLAAQIERVIGEAEVQS